MISHNNLLKFRKKAFPLNPIQFLNFQNPQQHKTQKKYKIKPHPIVQKSSHIIPKSNIKK